MPNYFDRYKTFRANGNMKPLPGITIPQDSNDKIAIYKKGQTRLDKISNTYYNNPYSGWLIMLANPEYGGLEFNIPDMTPIRVPFPFDSAVQRYITQVTNHKTLYGE
jgi:hypothetical protein